MKVKFARVLLCVGLLFVLRLSALGQKVEFFNNCTFDSSYTIMGICQAYGKFTDSLERFWFILTDPADMQKLQRDWVFSKPGRPSTYIQQSVDIYIIRGKRLAAPSGLIYPRENMITPGGTGRWYAFDTAKLIALHAAHPLHFHSEKKRFQTYVEYATYGNSILHDPKLLFFFEPSLRYEGHFTIIARRSAGETSPMFVTRDVENELKHLASADSFEVSTPINDSFNMAQRDWVKIDVDCARSLYDRYVPKRRKKGPWEPESIETVVFWRDDL